MGENSHVSLESSEKTCIETEDPALGWQLARSVIGPDNIRPDKSPARPSPRSAPLCIGLARTKSLPLFEDGDFFSLLGQSFSTSALPTFWAR